MQPGEGRTRVIVENVSPEIDGGRFPIKRTPGETVTVEADIYTDGHDAVSAVILFREAGDDEWHEFPMELDVNDRWNGELSIRKIGTAHYTILAWVDHFKAWARDFQKRLTAERDPEIIASQEIPLQREIGARLIDDAAAHNPPQVASVLESFAERLRDPQQPPIVGLDPALAALMFEYAPRRYATVYAPSPPAPLPILGEGRKVDGHPDSPPFPKSGEGSEADDVPNSPPLPNSGEGIGVRAVPSNEPRSGVRAASREGARPSPTTEQPVGADLVSARVAPLAITVDRVRARFSTWYELFPRSMASEGGHHGTLKDVEAFVPRVASMGFDVLYLPPIHPIGRNHRKGPNNAAPSPDSPTEYYDLGHPGSPWAIGSEEGGHTAIHPDLGTVDDFVSLVKTARELGVDIALDLAYQCSPDHPYVKEHPEWFKARPDGTIQYAENPPKKYQDIYPFDFESNDWWGLWQELERVIRYWVDLGVKVFRVDNPHTKSFHFWEWAITRLKAEHPDLIFLSEAFTRPKVMHYLAKLGFTQSYTYFAWRTTSWELTEYLTELTRTEQSEFFRPNFWPNTPDILTEFLQIGGRPAFMQRLVLAGTLTASYGIYGPAYELCEHEPAAPGSEEYLNSEKYEIRQRDLDQPGSLRDFIARVNRIRHDNPALQSNNSIMFHHVDNEQLLAYTKHTPDLRNIVLTVVNLDPHFTQSGWLELPLDMFDIDPHHAYLVEDMLNDHHYLWHGSRNYIELDPHTSPAHIFRIRRRMRTERDFDYYD